MAAKRKAPAAKAVGKGKHMPPARRREKLDEGPREWLIPVLESAYTRMAPGEEAVDETVAGPARAPKRPRAQATAAACSRVGTRRRSPISAAAATGPSGSGSITGAVWRRRPAPKWRPECRQFPERRTGGPSDRRVSTTATRGDGRSPAGA